MLHVGGGRGLTNEDRLSGKHASATGSEGRGQRVSRLSRKSGAFSIGCVWRSGNSCLTVYKLLLEWPTDCDKKKLMTNSQCLVQNCDISDNFPLFPFFLLCVVFKPETMCSELIEVKFCKMQESIFSLSFLCILFHSFFPWDFFVWFPYQLTVIYSLYKMSFALGIILRY